MIENTTEATHCENLSSSLFSINDINMTVNVKLSNGSQFC